MKQFLMVCVTVAASLFISNTAQAQMKIGSFDEQFVLQYMPGIEKLSPLLDSYLRDSLQVEYNYDLEQYQRKDSIFRKDSATMPAKARELATKELNQLKYKIVNWQSYQNQMYEAKQEELLYPFKQKVYASLEKIIREQKYTHVVKADAFLVFPPQDNLAIKVIRDLKLVLPKELEDQIKSIEGGAPKTAPATPTTKPAGSKG